MSYFTEVIYPDLEIKIRSCDNKAVQPLPNSGLVIFSPYEKSVCFVWPGKNKNTPLFLSRSTPLNLMP